MAAACVLRADRDTATAAMRDAACSEGRHRRENQPQAARRADGRQLLLVLRQGVSDARHVGLHRGHVSRRPAVPYDVAQQNQIEYVLDEVGCRPGSRIIDVGCGNGELLAAARRRGARPWASRSRPSRSSCAPTAGWTRGWSTIATWTIAWCGQFDAVIANGPIEHFVQARDAVEGQRRRDLPADVSDLSPADRSGFEQCESSSTRRSISCGRPTRATCSASPYHYRWGSRQVSLGDAGAQLWRLVSADGATRSVRRRRVSRCAKTVDGTHDYHLTSEHWLRRVQGEMCRAAFGHRGCCRHSLGVLARHPRQCVTMLTCMLVSQSWNWQFRTSDPPTRLLRQTWDYVPAGS